MKTRNELRGRRTGDIDTAASSLEEHLGAAIDCLLVDLLDSAAARLENAARITAEEIRSS